MIALFKVNPYFFIVLFVIASFSNSFTLIQSVNSDNNFQFVFSTYFGGSSDEFLPNEPVLPRLRLAVDSQNNLIVVGRTSSTDFPLKNSFQNTLGGSIDGIIAKFSSSGELLFSTYFGGSGNDYIIGTAIDSNDNIVVVGSTTSLDMPMKNSFQSKSSENGIQLEGFFAKFSPNGSLIFCSYLGGNGMDWLHDVTIDSSDNIIICSDTGSNNLITKNAIQTEKTGSLYSAYIAKFTPDGQNIIFSTYLSGNNSFNWLISLTTDSFDNIVLTGGSSSADFPIKNAFRPVYSGSRDGVIVKIDSNGQLLFSSYFGGSSDDFGESITIDSNDNIYITGTTYSSDFYSKNAFQTSCNGIDGFLLKISSSGSLVFSTCIGGNFIDNSWSVSVGEDKEIFIAGSTSSDKFPGIENQTMSSLHDAFLSVFSSNGQLLKSMYFGGSAYDDARSILVDRIGEILLVGYTYSPDIPILDAFQMNLSGPNDFFISKYSFNPTGLISNKSQSKISSFSFEIVCMTFIVLVYTIKKKRKNV